MCPCKNVGPVDRVVRFTIGLVAFALALTMFEVLSGTILGAISAAVGVIMIATAALGMCPLYLPFKLSTCKVK